MELVQRTMEPTGIPTFASAWKPTDAHPTAPEKYAVYNVMTTEGHHDDDGVRSYRLYVYLNLWTTKDPTDDIRRVREAMYAAGFALAEEMDTYNADTDQTLISWTWMGWEEGS